VIFLGEFSHCGYNCFLKKLGILLFVRIQKKIDQNMEKIDKIYKPQNWKKKHWYRGIYVCAL